MKSFHLLTGYTDEVQCYGDRAARRIERYARQHGHSFEVCRTGFDTARAPSWSKVKFLQDAINRRMASHVLWIDADAYILRDDFELSSAIASGKEWYFAEDANGLNA